MGGSEFGRGYFYGHGSNYKAYDRINFNRQFRSVLSFIIENHKGGCFLDAGCAFGYLARMARPYFDRINGFDISPYAISRARTVCPEGRFKVADLDHRLPYPDKTFDCITAMDVIEHTKLGAEHAIRNIAAKVRPGGHLILSAPIQNKLRKAFGWLDRDMTHRSVPTVDQLLKAAAKNGLEVIHIRYFLPLWGKRLYGIPAETEMYLRRSLVPSKNGHMGDEPA